MASQIVIERYRCREAIPAASAGRFAANASSVDDVVVAPEVSYLTREQLGSVGRNELTARVAAPLGDAVIDEHDAGLPGRET
jgi:hypothetical protein